MDVAPDVAEFANYAQANGVVLLSPCLGGAVDTTAFPHASDIVAGELDVYGQLDLNYVQQSAPHMRAIGKMIRRVLGIPQPQFPPSVLHPPSSQVAAKFVHQPKSWGPKIKMPTLKIDTTGILTAGDHNGPG